MKTTARIHSSPLMSSVQRAASARANIPLDAILAVRLGDFLEFFGADAKTASEILKITLTRRNETPMSGIPIHAADSYLTRLATTKKVYVLEANTQEPREYSFP